MKSPLTVLALVFAAGLTVTGCAQQPNSTGPLTATLVGPDDIRLNWQPAPHNALGQVVQYRNNPGGQFITLAYLPADATTYTHARLIPKTPFYYRVRAFFGQPTAPVTASLATTGAPPTDPNWAAPRDLPGAAPTDQHSLRTSTAAAGPTDLHAQPVGTNGIQLSWTDNATDADGYLVEVTAGKGTRVAAVLRPRIDRVGIFPLPDEHSAAYRIVAFYYGDPTPTVQQTTD